MVLIPTFKKAKYNNTNSGDMKRVTEREMGIEKTLWGSGGQK